MRVLLVDDEKELVSALAERLALRGIEAEWALSGDEALEKAETATFDIAVLDVKIPKMCGLEIKKNLEERCPGMKFIFVTGHGSEDDYQACIAEAGREYYLVKPVKIESLISKMKAALEDTGGAE